MRLAPRPAHATCIQVLGTSTSTSTTTRCTLPARARTGAAAADLMLTGYVPAYAALCARHAPAHNTLAHQLSCTRIPYTQYTYQARRRAASISAPPPHGTGRLKVQAHNSNRDTLIQLPPPLPYTPQLYRSSGPARPVLWATS